MALKPQWLLKLLGHSNFSLFSMACLLFILLLAYQIMDGISVGNYKSVPWDKVILIIFVNVWCRKETMAIDMVFNHTAAVRTWSLQLFRAPIQTKEQDSYRTRPPCCGDAMVGNAHWAGGEMQDPPRSLPQPLPLVSHPPPTSQGWITHACWWVAPSPLHK